MMGGVKRGEKPKGQIIAELMTEQPDLDNLGIVQELRKRGVEVRESYVSSVRTALKTRGTWQISKKQPEFTRIPQELRDRMYELYDQGCETGVIAERLNILPSTVSHYVNQYKRRNLDLSEGTLNARIADMVRKGHTVVEIMSELHTNRSQVLAVRKYLKDNGEDIGWGKGKGKGKEIRVNKPKPSSGVPRSEVEAIVSETDAEAIVTWAGAFRKLANYCNAHGYTDAYELAQAIAGIKGVTL